LATLVPYADPNFVDQSGWAPIHYAVKRGDVGVLRILLESKTINPNVKLHGVETALHMAARAGKHEIVEVLLESKTNVNEKNSEGWTPLALAAKSEGNVAILKSLVEKGANFEIRNNQGHTPLSLAKLNGDDEAVAYLMRLGAKPESELTGKKVQAPPPPPAGAKIYFQCCVSPIAGESPVSCARGWDVFSASNPFQSHEEAHERCSGYDSYILSTGEVF
jgi:hypothetical protein